MKLSDNENDSRVPLRNTRTIALPISIVVALVGFTLDSINERERQTAGRWTKRKCGNVTISDKNQPQRRLSRRREILPTFSGVGVYAVASADGRSRSLPCNNKRILRYAAPESNLLQNSFRSPDQQTARLTHSNDVRCGDPERAPCSEKLKGNTARVSDR